MPSVFQEIQGTFTVKVKTPRTGAFTYNVEHLYYSIVMDLIKALEEQNAQYWRVRNRIREERLKNKERLEYLEKKKRCRYATNLMIKNGSIVKSPCEVCGNKKSHTHHLNYEDPEAVIFLCAQHHAEWHKNNPPV